MQFDVALHACLMTTSQSEPDPKLLVLRIARAQPSSSRLLRAAVASRTGRQIQRLALRWLSLLSTCWT